METALQKQEQPIFALTINEFKAQLAEMDKFIAECLIPDSEPGKCDGDYGIIPGCGDKPTLHQPGVDKLSRLFSLVPDFEIIEKEASDKLVRYVLKCRVSINDIFIGAGLGACSTAESKYHKALNKIDFVVEWEATAEQKATGKRVKKQSKKGTDYWVYEVAITLPAYELENTIIKMAAVRAKRAAVITATRLHHKFTQDLEDMKEVMQQQNGGAEPELDQNADAPNPAPGGYISAKQRKMIFAKSYAKSMNEEDIRQLIYRVTGSDSTSKIKKGQMDQLLQEIENWTPEREPGQDDDDIQM